MPSTLQPNDATKPGDIITDRGCAARHRERFPFWRGTARLELRLDQSDQLRRRPRKPQRRRDCQFEGNKTDVDDDKIRSMVKAGGREFANVGVFEQIHFRSCTE